MSGWRADSPVPPPSVRKGRALLVPLLFQEGTVEAVPDWLGQIAEEAALASEHMRLDWHAGGEKDIRQVRQLVAVDQDEGAVVLLVRLLIDGHVGGDPGHLSMQI